MIIAYHNRKINKKIKKDRQWSFFCNDYFIGSVLRMNIQLVSMYSGADV